MYGYAVLILIVVEDGLVPMTVQRHTTKPLEVLILVVVDNGLVPRSFGFIISQLTGLNPCCSGQWSSTDLIRLY